MKPLFIPLMTKYFLDFKLGLKDTEFRKYGRGFTEKTCMPGREVILSKGYSGERLRGKIKSFAIKTMDTEVYGKAQKIICIRIIDIGPDSGSAQPRGYAFA